MTSLDSSSTSVPQKKSRKKIIVIVGAVIVAISCLYVGIAVLNFARVTANQDEIEAVMKSFMTAMKNKDTQTAMTLISSRAKRAVDMPRQLSMQLAWNNSALFDGYQDVSINALNVSTEINSDPNIPQGTVVNLKGTVFYENGFTGTLVMTLEEENSTWKIDYFQAAVSPNKIK